MWDKHRTQLSHAIGRGLRSITRLRIRQKTLTDAIWAEVVIVDRWPSLVSFTAARRGHLFSPLGAALAFHAKKFGARLCASVLAVGAAFLVTDAALADAGFRFLEIDGHQVKWGAPTLGRGATLTFAIVSDPNRFSGKINCRRISGIRPILTRSHLSHRDFERELKAALAMWEHVANVRFRPAKRASAADVLISAETGSKGVAYADVALAASDDVEGAVRRIVKGIVCLSPGIRWTTHDERPMAAKPPGDRGPYRLRYALAHEIGHVLGLDHPSPTGELMSFEYESDSRHLRAGDVAGIMALYGPRRATLF